MGKYGFVVGVDIIATIIVLVILAATLFEKRGMENRRNAFIPLCIVQIVISVSELLMFINGMSFPHWLIVHLLWFASTGLFFEHVLLIRYMNTVAIAKGIESYVKHSYAFLSLISFAAFAAFTVFGTIGRLYQASEGTIKYLDLYRTEQYVYILMYIISIVFILIFSPKIGKKDTVVYLGYYLFPVAGICTGIWKQDYNWCVGATSVSIMLMFLTLQHKRQTSQEKEYFSYFNSMASIFDTIYILDKERNSYIDLSLEAIQGGRREEYVCSRDIQNVLWESQCVKVIEPHRDSIKRFTNLSSLDYRLKDKKRIDIELLSTENRWIRFLFIKIEEGTDGAPKYIFATQDIDDSKRKEEVLTAMSTTDELTKLFNRHAFEEHTKAWRKTGVPSSLWYANIDINGLKQTNDTKGHKAGDEIIVAMADCIRKASAGVGRAYRVGGDEFILLLMCSRLQKDEILQRLEIIRDKWSGMYSEKLEFSIGIVGMVEMPGATFDELQKEADERMYASKKMYYINNEDRRQQ